MGSDDQDHDHALPQGSLAILDTSVLIAMGGPDTETYGAFERYVTRRNFTVRIPEFKLVEYADGTARGFCSERCRSWLEYHEDLTPVAENDVHHLWDGEPEGWHRAL